MVIVFALATACGLQILPAANAALSGWSVSDSQPDFSSDTPTWTVTVSTNNSSSSLTSGDLATFIIADSTGQALGSLDQEIATDTTSLTFVVPLDPTITSGDASETDFTGTFMVSHPIDDDEIFDFPLKKTAQAANWKLSSSVITTTSKPDIWTLKFAATSADSALAKGDNVEVYISDAADNPLANDSLTVTKNNTTALSFKIQIDPTTLTSSWSANTLDGILILQSISGNEQVVEFTAPINGLPDRPTTADDYIKSSSDYSSKTFIFQPTGCVDVPVSAKLNDPYNEVTNVLFTLADASGSVVTQGADDSVSSSTFSTSLYICPNDLKGLSSPLNLSIGLSFGSSDRDYSELSTPFNWKLYVKPVVTVAPVAPGGGATTVAKASKITCVRAKPYSKITTTKSKCPTGYKKK